MNLKRLNEAVECKKFKLEAISAILLSVRPGMFMAKLDLKDAYYSASICKNHQSLFQYQTFLFKFTTLPNGYAEGPRKFTKLMKPPLKFLRKIEKILVAGYFDELITVNSTHSSCSDCISKITLLLSKIGFVIHQEKSTFNPCQEIENLGFLISSIEMIVSHQLKTEYIITLCQVTCYRTGSNKASC